MLKSFNPQMMAVGFIVAAVSSLSYASTAARGPGLHTADDDDCQWRVIDTTSENTGNGGGNCPNGYITQWYERYYVEENSCTGEIQNVDGGSYSDCEPDNG